jgi:hypothetical protein
MCSALFSGSTDSIGYFWIICMVIFTSESNLPATSYGTVIDTGICIPVEKKLLQWT